MCVFYVNVRCKNNRVVYLMTQISKLVQVARSETKLLSFYYGILYVGRELVFSMLDRNTFRARK